nr:BRO family protein [uncultured Litoreibacter sp.]
MASALKPEEYQKITSSTVHSMDNSIPFPNSGMLAVNESSLYALIFKSRKASAEAFRYWVTSTVLPSIRKDGAYVMGEEKVSTGEMDEDELIAKAMAALQRKVERRTEERDLYKRELEFLTISDA